MSDLIFANLLLRETINDARSEGIKIPKMTVYKYPGMSRGDYHTYQVYAETGEAEHRRVEILGDYGGYYASEAKVAAINEHYLNTEPFANISRETDEFGNYLPVDSLQ